jgi:hypothetical protein
MSRVEQYKAGGHVVWSADMEIISLCRLLSLLDVQFVMLFDTLLRLELILK